MGQGPIFLERYRSNFSSPKGEVKQVEGVGRGAVPPCLRVSVANVMSVCTRDK